MFNPCMLYEDVRNQIELVCNGVSEIFLSYGNIGYGSGILKFNWGDGDISTFTEGSARPRKFYSTPFTGKVKISGDLSKLDYFIFFDGKLNEINPTYSNQNLSVNIKQLYKATNLGILSFGQTTNLTCTLDEIPKTLREFSVNSIIGYNNVNLSGNINDLNMPLITTLGLNGIDGQNISYTPDYRNNILNAFYIRFDQPLTMEDTDVILIDYDKYIDSYPYMNEPYISLKSLGRTPESDVAYNSLIAKGYSVYISPT